jgi:hypothetical protein
MVTVRCVPTMRTGAVSTQTPSANGVSGPSVTATQPLPSARGWAWARFAGKSSHLVRTSAPSFAPPEMDRAHQLG